MSIKRLLTAAVLAAALLAPAAHAAGPHCGKTYSRATFHLTARAAFRAYPYTPHELKTLRRVVRCQTGGARSRRIVRFHYARYAHTFRQRFGFIHLGGFEATAYGPPWNAMEGGGITSTGVALYAGVPNYGVAVDPSVIRYGTRLRIWPNPFGTRHLFVAFDTGGAIRGNRIDFYDWLGRGHQNNWGRRSVSVRAVR